MHEQTFIDHYLRNYALERYNYFGSMSFQQLNAAADQFHRLPETFLDFLIQYRKPVLQWFSLQGITNNTQIPQATLAFYSENMLYTIHKKNQFLLIAQEEQQQLNRIYMQLLHNLWHALLQANEKSSLARQLTNVLATHYDHLIVFSNTLVAVNNGPEPNQEEVICAEYSPELQLNILQLQKEQLCEPILDLGCGEKAHLVQYLRAYGKLAYGIDRLITVRGKRYITQGDWLNCPLRQAQWGTIISHMAFSNHFLHHHLRSNGQAELYARRYIKILQALQPGGSFVYTPGVPFIERLLPNDLYTVERSLITALAGSPIDRALQTQFGGTVFYACKVTRMIS